MNDQMFVLGADDPEMQAIERLLAAHAVTTVTAKVDGKRAYPGNAYKAEVPEEARAVLARGGRVYLVECVDDAPAGAVRIDHHKPGHPGFGRTASEYWDASSLGQTVRALRRDLDRDVGITQAMRITAAADHCLGAAYRGECPGVSPVALREWRTATRAAFQRRSPGEVRLDQEVAMAAILAAPHVEVRGCGFYDLRNREIPELPEAAAILQVAVMYSLIDARAARRKVGVLNGRPLAIRAWLAWAASPESGLQDPYGDPARGFAGAYAD